MTEDEIKAIEARANAATPVVESRLIERENGPDGFALLDADGHSIGLAYELADAEFAYHAQRDTLSLIAEVLRLRDALEKQPAAEAHVADMFCSAYHGKPCGCGHAEIAKALGREESPV